MYFDVVIYGLAFNIIIIGKDTIVLHQYISEIAVYLCSLFYSVVECGAVACISVFVFVVLPVYIISLF